MVLCTALCTVALDRRNRKTKSSCSSQGLDYGAVQSPVLRSSCRSISSAYKLFHCLIYRVIVADSQFHVGQMHEKASKVSNPILISKSFNCKPNANHR